MASPKKTPRLNNRKTNDARNRQVIKFTSAKTGRVTSKTLQHIPKSLVVLKPKEAEEVVSE